MTVLSKFLANSIVSRPCVCPVSHAKQLQRVPACVEISFSGNAAPVSSLETSPCFLVPQVCDFQDNIAQSFMASDSLILTDSTLVFIPCISAYATWLLCGNLSATIQDVRHSPGSLCVAIGPFDTGMNAYPISALPPLPLLQKAILHGCVHCLLDWTAIAATSSNAISRRMAHVCN